MVSKSDVEILNSLKLLLDTQSNGRFTTDLQVCKRASDSDPRTGTFHETRGTVSDTACSVKGVLGNDKHDLQGKDKHDLKTFYLLDVKIKSSDSGTILLDSLKPYFCQNNA